MLVAGNWLKFPSKVRSKIVIVGGERLSRLMNLWQAIKNRRRPVVRKVDNAIHWVSHYLMDSVVCFTHWTATYPVDSVIHLSNNPSREKITSITG